MRRALAALIAVAAPAALAVALAGGATARARPAPARAAQSLNRYTLVHGCYSLRSASGQSLGAGGPYRMQATALGEYLLYGTGGVFLSHGFTTATAPGQFTVWRVDGNSLQGFKLTNLGDGSGAQVSFSPASGCAVYPEGQVDATGTPSTGSTPAGGVTGTIDAHTHVTAFEFLGGDWHCGRPWHQFGIPYALPDCAPYEKGSNGQVESFLDYGAPLHMHDTRGWPTFRDWPSPTDLAEEGDYYTGIERAWKAGLRVMVTQLVDNEALCQLMSTRRNPCNDMAAVHLQAQDLHALQDYIDAQAGGPGRGFFRIVTDPFVARQVINQGKLAVVEGIEVSHLFNCGEYLGVAQCSPARIDAGLSEVRALGVSTFFPIHKFDNAFGGTKMDGGETGVLVNSGNHLETGQFWNVETCKGPEHDSTQLTPAPLGGVLSKLMSGPARTLLPSGLLPLYPPAPHCNTRGLTSLGAYLINKMVQRHFIVELDHMDAKTADAALSLLESHHYSGVISAHSWDSPQENPRIYNLGGFVTPIAGASPAAFVDQWRTSLTIRNKRFYNGSGFGYGADMNGLAEQSQPTSGSPISYPFRSYDGRVTFAREQWGQRVFDLNKDGVANYGMYPDWLAELQTLAGRPIMTDMFRGAEAYLEMWERATGVRASGCLAGRGRFGSSGSGPLRLGASFPALLYAAGQPAARPGSAYQYCVSGPAGGGLAAVFGSGGQVTMVAGSVSGYSAGGIRPGGRASLLSGRAGRRRRLASSLGHGLWLGRQRMPGGARFVYRVAGGRVRVVAVARGSFSAQTLARELRASGLG